MERSVILTMRLSLFLPINMERLPILSQKFSESSCYRTASNTCTVFVVNSLIIIGEMNTQTFLKIFPNIFKLKFCSYKC